MQYDTVPAAMSHDELEFLLPVPVPKEKVMDAAVERYGFCPDAIDQETEDATVGALVDVYDLLDFKKDAYELLCQIGNRCYAP